MAGSIPQDQRRTALTERQAVPKAAPGEGSETIQTSRHGAPEPKRVCLLVQDGEHSKPDARRPRLGVPDRLDGGDGLHGGQPGVALRVAAASGLRSPRGEWCKYTRKRPLLPRNLAPRASGGSTPTLDRFCRETSPRGEWWKYANFGQVLPRNLAPGRVVEVRQLWTGSADKPRPGASGGSTPACGLHVRSRLNKPIEVCADLDLGSTRSNKSNVATIEIDVSFAFAAPLDGPDAPLHWEQRPLSGPCRDVQSQGHLWSLTRKYWLQDALLVSEDDAGQTAAIDPEQDQIDGSSMERVGRQRARRNSGRSRQWDNEPPNEPPPDDRPPEEPPVDPSIDDVTEKPSFRFGSDPTADAEASRSSITRPPLRPKHRNAEPRTPGTPRPRCRPTQQQQTIAAGGTRARGRRRRLDQPPAPDSPAAGRTSTRTHREIPARARGRRHQSDQPRPENDTR